MQFEAKNKIRKIFCHDFFFINFLSITVTLSKCPLHVEYIKKCGCVCLKKNIKIWGFQSRFIMMNFTLVSELTFADLAIEFSEISLRAHLKLKRGDLYCIKTYFWLILWEFITKCSMACHALRFFVNVCLTCTQTRISSSHLW